MLAAADSPRLRRFVDRYGMRLGAARFVGGETLDEGVFTLRGVDEAGVLRKQPRLGWHGADRAEANQVATTYRDILRRIDAEQLQTNISVKPSHAGAVLDAE